MCRLAFAIAFIASGLGGETLVIDVQAPARPFPHFWEQSFGSGRAVLSLRESYRHDLDLVRSATGFRYVRFHGIFHDEDGVYTEDRRGRPVLNFNQVDLIYDGLLARGVKPYVELSFMPRQLATKPVEHTFWYRPVVVPPKDYAHWAALIEAFGRHLVDRYGIDEVASWYFEVWNEPNIDFWAGEPKFETYCGLYEAAAWALKRVSPRLRVGGPATAQAAWTGRFIDHCRRAAVPIDFVSTHAYANDSPQKVQVAGSDDRRTLLARAMDKVYREVKNSAMPELPIHWTEFNASYMNEVDVTDSPYMGPWLADTIAQCDGKVDLMSYWTFSDVFEEQGIFKTPFYGGFGLLANHSIPKASFNVFRLLHRLGDQRLSIDSESALVTCRDDGALAILLWNYAEPGWSDPAKAIELELRGTKARQAKLWRVDSAHSSSLETWIRMGRPASLRPAQIQELRTAGALATPETLRIDHGRFAVELPAPGLALVEIREN
jgi:xylan 1,4-beta-xylosidase